MSFPITIRQLQIFQEVAKQMSFTRAAKFLHLSQPAVSMQVKQLENISGLPLFETIGKSVSLTEAGKEMLRLSRQVLENLAEMEEVFASLSGVESGTLNLAVPETAHQFMTLVLAEFRKAHPNIRFNLLIANRQGLLDHMHDNTTDLVIMGQPPDNMPLTSIGFMENPLVVIAAPDHPLTRHNHIPLTELVKYEFVVRETGSGTRLAMKRFFNEHNVSLRATIEVTNNEAIKHSVAAGLGLGIVSLHTLQQELALKQVSILDVMEFPIQRIWFAVHHQNKQLGPATRAFLEFTIKNTRTIWLQGFPRIAKWI
ncbi:MAG: LysR family transcriptional regulator [Proteobacteria bacterium]|nr:LysR family transcriptional regulator [Pseudomonadota bacterium]